MAGKFFTRSLTGNETRLDDRQIMSVTKLKLRCDYFSATDLFSFGCFYDVIVSQLDSFQFDNLKLFVQLLASSLLN